MSAGDAARSGGPAARAGAGAGAEGPLAGVRVVEMATLLPGPYAGHLLARMGCEVVKVEPPTGDPAKWLNPDGYRQLHADKEVLNLDLKTDEGRDRLYDLVRDADLFLTTNRASTLERLGASPKALLDVNPTLVYVHLLGHADGERVGHDLTYLAEAGVLDPDDPAMPPLPLADLASAERVVAEAAAGLLDRDRRGAGSVRTVACEAVAREWAVAGGAVQRLLDTVPGYGLYRCADDRWLALVCLEREHWEAFCAAVDRPDWRPRHRPEGSRRYAMRTDLEELFRTEDRTAWLELLADHDVPVAPVRGPPVPGDADGEPPS